MTSASYKPGACWRKNRLAARILLRQQSGRLSTRDRQVAQVLTRDHDLSDRLIDQAMHSLNACRKTHPVAR